MNLERFKASLEGSIVIKKGDYDYFVHPLTDGILRIEPWLLRDISEAVDEISNRDYERIVTVEAMGLPVATALSLKVNKPYTIIRKRKYGLEGEVEVAQRTGYSESKLYVNGLEEGNRVLVLDVVISTGGTLRAVLSALRGLKCRVEDVIIVIEKDRKVTEELSKEFGIKIKTLVSIKIENGRVRVL
jgi:adenine phosphoribosyltransferase